MGADACFKVCGCVGRRVPARVIWRVSTLASLCLSATWAAEPPPVAYVQVDAETEQAPYDSIRLTRGGVPIASDTPMRPCDKVEFVAGSGGPPRVRIGTVQGGRVTVLDKDNVTFEVACDTLPLKESLARIWREIAGPAISGVQAAAPRRVLAGSRGAPLELPVFDAPTSTIVAGRRALFLTWRGGSPPYRVVLFRAGPQGPVKIIDRGDINQSWVELPEVEIERGRHRVELHDLGSGKALAEDNLMALEPSELPRRPDPLNDSSLTNSERELLYAYYLEGLGNGGWTFEAMQRIRGIRDQIPAARVWLRGYGGG